MTNYYSSGDLARLCGVSRPTASNWIARGVIEPAEIVTVGGASIWTESQARRIAAEYLAEKTRREHVMLLKAELRKLKTPRERRR